MLDYFPTGAPNWYGDIESEEELDDVCGEYCCVFILTLDNVHIKKGVSAPCIPSSKCIHKENELKLNGKIVSADTLTMVCCELDYISETDGADCHRQSEAVWLVMGVRWVWS